MRPDLRNNIAISLLDLGEPERALDHFQKAISGFRSAGDQSGVIRTLNNLGNLYSRGAAQNKLGKPGDALGGVHGKSLHAGNGTHQLAANLTKSGETGRALALHQQALTDFRILGDRKSQATAHNGLGEAHFKEDSIDASADNHLKALDIARDIGATEGIAARTTRSGTGSISTAVGWIRRRST
ncbi:hypothetical protein SANTM175S_11020 [Streptomyces antimycoticus]